MAEKEVELTLKWENNKSFEMTETSNGVTKTVIKTEENDHLADMWQSTSTACLDYMDAVLRMIGGEMAQP